MKSILTITDVRVVPGDSGFLLDDGKTSILFDSGFGFTGSKLTENIANILGNRTLDYILLSHSHYDHVLGAAHVMKKYPNAKVVAGSHAAKILQKPSALAVMKQLDQKAALQHNAVWHDDPTEALHVDIIAYDGDVITCGDFNFSAIELPGHTKCSLAFYAEKERLLLGTETLGVFFGENTYLPSYLVGYQMTMDSFKRVNKLHIDQILIPHHGIVKFEDARRYLRATEQISIEVAQIIKQQFLAGKTKEEIAACLESMLYKKHVAEIYPIDAFRLNTSIMIELIIKEFTL